MASLNTGIVKVIQTDLKKSLSEQHGSGMAWARHGMCESDMATLCQMGKTQPKPLVVWQRHGMCELALNVSVEVLAGATATHVRV
jgi:hypothetical protein